MVVKRQCSFCAREIEPGTGSMFVKRDGTVFHFCTSSCRKQQLHLGRVGHRFKWTRAYELKRAAERSAGVKASAAATRTARGAPATPAPKSSAAATAEPPGPVEKTGATTAVSPKAVRARKPRAKAPAEPPGA